PIARSTLPVAATSVSRLLTSRSLGMAALAIGVRTAGGGVIAAWAAAGRRPRRASSATTMSATAPRITASSAYGGEDDVGEVDAGVGVGADAGWGAGTVAGVAKRAVGGGCVTGACGVWAG